MQYVYGAFRLAHNSFVVDVVFDASCDVYACRKAVTKGLAAAAAVPADGLLHPDQAEAGQPIAQPAREIRSSVDWQVRVGGATGGF